MIHRLSTLAHRIDAFLDCAFAHGVRVKRIKVSMSEFYALLCDPEWVDRYSDGYYRGVQLKTLSRRPVWTSPTSS